MPRKERSDKGQSRYNYQGVARRRTPNNTGKKYTTKPVEPRGEQPREFRVQKSFWRKFTMDEVITWSAAELEEKITKFYDDYEERQLKAHGARWWYPEDPRNRIIDLRYNK
jgi:hypothetical protein